MGLADWCWTSLIEDDIGLLVSGELTNLSLSADVRASMKHGTIDGLSIGGFLPKTIIKQTGSRRTHYHKVDATNGNIAGRVPVRWPARIDMASVKGEDLADAIKDIETYEI